ncbi:MAG: PQQ-dependent dehydrogenase, methanol/ethanol family [Bryobacterales bacterium]|nr:PQQ-dependent dehydrogenase, methanol/ethanol family [Bryobacterales bacterium]
MDPSLSLFVLKRDFACVAMTLACCVAVAYAQNSPTESSAGRVDDERIDRIDDNDPGQWLAYGRGYSQHRFSPLEQINRQTVGDLGLNWAREIEVRHRLQSSPIVVDGVLYFTDSWSVVSAVDADTGETIWTFDPKTRRTRARWSCCGGPINRGVAVYGGRVYTATFDARLVAIDARTGEKVWDVGTDDYPSRVPYTISGAPLAAAGKVFIGNSGSEWDHRGYVTAYNAETGEKEWRFFTVPGDPSMPFEHPEMEVAAETWNGEWWKLGGGGTVWNSMTYDADLHTVYIGVGNGTPWSRKIRSPGGGDNLFLSSIVALDPEAGRMKWYYQTTPGDNWDYTATQDIVLADMEVDGADRKVLMQAPKNGFFYVLDRINGELLRAHPYGAMTWATHVDMETGRPVENPDVVWEEKPQWILPGNTGAHNWEPMSFDADKGLMYIPTHDTPFFFALPKDYRETGVYRPRERTMNLGVAMGAYRTELIEQAGARPEPKGFLKAFDPLTGETVWKVQNKSARIGGVLSTAGGLVFQGDGSGTLSAYDSETGERLWEFDAYGSIIAPPVTYQVGNTQYVAVVVGASFAYLDLGKLLVFSLGADHALPEPPLRDRSIPAQPPMIASAEELAQGEELYHQFCASCHGYAARGYRNADLRLMSRAIHDAFQKVVREGLLLDLGMDSFGNDLDETETELIRQYIISRANIDREASGR